MNRISHNYTSFVINCAGIYSDVTLYLQSLMMYVFEMFVKFPYLLEDFNLHRKQIKDINGRYVTKSILHNEEISNIYTTLKDQITENVRKEYLLKEVYNLSEEDKQKLITLANQIKEAKKQ